MHRPLACLVLFATLCGMAPSGAATVDPAATMQRIAAEPYRYGGDVSGLPIGDKRDLHLVLGLDGPRPDGMLQGWAILFDSGRRLVAMGPVQGSLRADPSERGHPPGQGHCHLAFAFPAGQTELNGLCTAGTIAGEIVSAPQPPGLLRRLVAWWGDDAVSGRAWLDAASFDPHS